MFRLAYVRKDRVQGVVVRAGYRVVLMIVAARARYGQPKKTSRNRIDAIVHSLGRTAREFAPETQEAERSQMPRFSAGYAIGRQLIEHESIVGQVLIQRPNHPVAIRI